MLAATVATADASQVTVGSNALQIAGDNDADAITIASDGTTLTITDTGPGGITPLAPCVVASATVATCPVAPGGETTTIFFANLGDGDDSFTNQNFAVFGEIFGFSDTGAKTIDAGPGDQIVLGGGVADSLMGGEGNDSFFDGGSAANNGGGNDTIIGGPGNDTAQYSREGTAPPLTLTLDGLANDGQQGEQDNVQVENLIGSTGDDVLVGDGSANTLTGVTGDDQISGLGGNDELFGDFGPSSGAARAVIPDPVTNDVLDGGAGRDSLTCGPGFDLALHDPVDAVQTSCERIGAAVGGESSRIAGKKRKAKILVDCPESETFACVGTMTLTAGGKRIAGGDFAVAAGAVTGAKAKLSKKGAKAVKRAGGSLLATVSLLTTEPGGTSESTGRILLYR